MITTNAYGLCTRQWLATDPDMHLAWCGAGWLHLAASRRPDDAPGPSEPYLNATTRIVQRGGATARSMITTHAYGRCTRRVLGHGPGHAPGDQCLRPGTRQVLWPADPDMLMAWRGLAWRRVARCGMATPGGVAAPG
jgi:hypothetical protein